MKTSEKLWDTLAAMRPYANRLGIGRKWKKMMNVKTQNAALDVWVAARSKATGRNAAIQLAEAAKKAHDVIYYENLIEESCRYGIMYCDYAKKLQKAIKVKTATGDADEPKRKIRKL